MPDAVECLIKGNDDVIKILLVLKVLATDDTQVNNKLCRASKTRLFFGDDLFCLLFQHKLRSIS